MLEQLKKHLVITTDNLKWSGELEVLKDIMDCILNRQTNWTKPGGYCRKTEADDLIIRWYSDNHTLTTCGSISEDLIRYLRLILSSNQNTVGSTIPFETSLNDQHSECSLSQDSDLSDGPERQLLSGEIMSD